MNIRDKNIENCSDNKLSIQILLIFEGFFLATHFHINNRNSDWGCQASKTTKQMANKTQYAQSIFLSYHQKCYFQKINQKSLSCERTPSSEATAWLQNKVHKSYG